MAYVEVIKPTKTSDGRPIELGETPNGRKLRVAAYVRVSTPQELQERSYEYQIDYFTKLINKNPNMELVGIFGDKGVSGATIKERDGFKEMLAQARAGKIDKILTKSVSRFSRNIIDTAEITRELKGLNVEVIFEEEHLSSFDMSSDTALYILSTIAQEEMRNQSESIRWAYRNRMGRGAFSLGYAHFLGYRKGPDGRPQIVEKEAKIVRRIYQMFLDGYSMQKIADTLTENKIKTPSGKKKWNASTIKGILTNEKYAGSALLQKTFTEDYLTHAIRENKGERMMYYIKYSHEPIIDRNTFREVQKMLGGKAAERLALLK